MRYLYSGIKRKGGHTLSEFRDLLTRILFSRDLNRTVQGLAGEGRAGERAVTTQDLKRVERVELGRLDV